VKISVFGLGYVGAVSCGCLAELGHEVVGVDVAESKVDLVNRGRSPIIEPQLPEILEKAHNRGLIRATTDPAEAVRSSELAFVCVGTPSLPTGGVDDRFLKQVVVEIGNSIRSGRQSGSPFVVAVRSTCLPPVHQQLQEILAEASGAALGVKAAYVCHPEFLRECDAVADFFDPPKIIFGTDDDSSHAACKSLYPNIKAPTFFTSVKTAAMVKYADNAFHAVKVTFANEIGILSRAFGVDSRRVMELFCEDTKLNISPKYLRPGGPYGGSCLPKDVAAMLDAARQEAVPLTMLNAVRDSNEVQMRELNARIRGMDRPTVAVVGMAFKEGTDDVRQSPMVSVVEYLLGKGCPVRIYDQHLAIQNLTGANKSFALQSIPHLATMLSNDLGAVIEGSDVVIVSHRLDASKWQSIRWNDQQRIIDMANVAVLQQQPNYEGIYW
jgi:GDP-mannose 6-dehydrogenase